MDDAVMAPSASPHPAPSHEDAHALALSHDGAFSGTAAEGPVEPLGTAGDAAPPPPPYIPPVAPATFVAPSAHTDGDAPDEAAEQRLPTLSHGSFSADLRAITELPRPMDPSSDLTSDSDVSQTSTSSEHVGVPMQIDAPREDPLKEALESHPLFPLLVALREKCDAIVHTKLSQVTRDETAVATSSSSKDVDELIEEYAAEQALRGVPMFTADHEVDELVVRAIRVYRIHAAELSRLDELCDTFCDRFMENARYRLMHGGIASLAPSKATLPAGAHSQNSAVQYAPPPATGNPFPVAGHLAAPAPPSLHTSSVPGTAMVAVPAHNAPNDNSQQHHARVDGGHSMATTTGGNESGRTVVRKTSLPASESKATAGGPVLDQPSQERKSRSPAPSRTDDDDEPSEGTAVPGRQEGGVGVRDRANGTRRALPKQTIQVLKEWLFAHTSAPYPSEDEKRALATQTGISMNQLNNWFVNARRRILHPAMDPKKRPGGAGVRAPAHPPPGVGPLGAPTGAYGVQRMWFNGPHG